MSKWLNLVLLAEKKDIKRRDIPFFIAKKILDNFYMNFR